MLKKSHALITREWKSIENDTIVISQEGCIIDFCSLEMHGFFSMPEQPEFEPADYTLNEEFIVFLGFKLYFNKNEEDKFYIDNESEGYQSLLEYSKK